MILVLVSTNRVAHLSVGGQTLAIHAGGEGELFVEVIVDDDLPLPGGAPMKASGVLDETSLERDRHGEEKGVERWQIKALAQK